jgi:hypothetical protein
MVALDDDYDDDGRWTGREGEKAFDALCAKARVTCNPAKEDEKGWDFHIHFRDLRIPFVALDERRAGPEALVQVKTTRGSVRSWSISLRNALHLIRSPLPAFILLYVLDEEGNASSVYGVHLWHGDIARIQLAARETEHQEDVRLNRRFVAFSFCEANRRDDVLGWIRSEIEAVAGDYATAKARFRDTVGYGAARDVIRVTARDAPEDLFIDLQIGLIDGMAVERATVTSRRFGIEAAQPHLSFEGVTLHLMPAGSAGRLRLRSSDGDNLVVPATIYYGGVPGTNRYKARVVAHCLELICDHKGEVSVDAHLPYDKIASLAEIDLFAFLQAHGRTKIGLVLLSAAGPIDLGFIRISTSPRDRESWSRMRLCVEALQAIADYEGVPPVETSIGVLGQLIGPMVVLDALARDRRMRLDFAPLETDGDHFTLHLAYGAMLIDGQVIGVLSSRPVLSDAYADERREIRLGASRILYAVHGEDDGGLREAYLDALDRLSEDHVVLATGDMMRILDTTDEERGLIVDQPRSLPPQDAPAGD